MQDNNNPTTEYSIGKTKTTADSVMEGDVHTESEQTKSDEAAYKAAPTTEVADIHRKSTEERTKRTWIRCVTTAFCAVAIGVTATIIKNRK